MVLSNFMCLCEFAPDQIYEWFMSFYIDAYDWVMVPNIYGMSQYADGGLMTTKPYISSSNYILKMSNYPKGDWCEIWDALYWRFIHKHQNFFLQNPRLKMIANSIKKMSPQKLNQYIQVGKQFLTKLDETI
jgi:deoxyribodipyrimidine photolyase-related protein